MINEIWLFITTHKLFVWFIGYILLYILIRVEGEESDSWGEVFLRLLFSCFSWAGVLVWLIFCPGERLLNYLKTTKPPKWL